MKKKLFNKVLIIILVISVLSTDTVLANIDNIGMFKEYLLNNFIINIDSEKYILDKSIDLENDINILIQESISNVLEYSEIKSEEVEKSLIEYGDSIKEKLIYQLDEMRSSFSSNIANEVNVDEEVSNDEEVNSYDKSEVIENEQIEANDKIDNEED